MSFTWADRFILILGTAEVAWIGDNTDAILSEIRKLQLNAKERDEAAECVQEIYAAIRRNEPDALVFDKFAKLKANQYIGAWSSAWFASDSTLYDRYAFVNEYGQALTERIRRDYDDDVAAGRVVYHIANWFKIKESLSAGLYQYYEHYLGAHEKTLYEWTQSSFGIGKPKITFFAPALSTCWVLIALVLLVMYPVVWTFMAEVAVFFLVWYGGSLIDTSWTRARKADCREKLCGIEDESTRSLALAYFDNLERMLVIHAAWPSDNTGILSALADQSEHQARLVYMAGSIVCRSVTMPEIVRISEYSSVRLGLGSAERNGSEMDQAATTIDSCIQSINAGLNGA